MAAPDGAEQAVDTAAQWAEVERLIRAYLAELPFEIDFQDLDRELAELAAGVRPARRGRVPRPSTPTAAPRSASSASAASPRARPSSSACTWTRSAAGRGAGRALAAAAVEAARGLGYRRLLLDTVAWMEAAIATYEGLGFEQCEPYRHNPLPEARFFALDL